MKKNLMYYFLNDMCYWTPRLNERGGGYYEFMCDDNDNDNDTVTLIESRDIPYMFGTFPIVLVNEVLNALEEYAYNVETDVYEVENIPVSLIADWYNKYVEYLEPVARFPHVYDAGYSYDDDLPF